MKLNRNRSFCVLAAAFAAALILIGFLTGSPIPAGEEKTKDDTSDVVVPTRYVAVGSSGTVIYSTDGGKTWTEGDLGTAASLYGIATDAKGLWMAVGGFGEDAYVYVSTDGGESWTETLTVNFNYFRGVATDGGGNWVVVGEDSMALFSGIIRYSDDDGDSWSAGSPAGNGLSCVATDAQGRWVAAGYDDSFGGDSNVRYSTNNGEDWTAGATVTTTGFNGIYTNGSGLWVMVGYSGLVKYSSNGGASWTDGTNTSSALRDCRKRQIIPCIIRN